MPCAINRPPDGSSRAPRRGAVLIEAVLAALVWGVLVGSAHFATIRYWRDRLHDLDKTRLYYDGIRP